MAINFLQQFKEAGALDLANPAEAAYNALEYKKGQAAVNSVQADTELKIIEMGKEYLKRTNDLDDYKKLKSYMSSKFGVNTDLMPEFETEEEFQAVKPSMIYNADDLAKLKSGKAIKLYDKKTGELVGEFDQSKIMEFKSNGMLSDDYVREGDLGLEKMREKNKAEGKAEGSKDNGPYRKGQIRTSKRGDTEIEEIYTDGKWTQRTDESGKPITSPRYKSEVNVNLGTSDKVVEEANKKFGGGVGDRASERIKLSQEATNQNMQLDIVAEAIGKGVDTGLGEETLLNLKSFAQTLGFEIKDLGPQELIRKVSNEMALRLRNPESGLGLTGNTSNRDLSFLQNSVVGLQRTESGNKMIIDTMKKLNQFKIDMANYQQKLIDDNNGSIPSNLDSLMLKYANDYKIFTPEEKTELTKLNQKIKETKTYNGRTILIFEDGSRAYANQ